MVQFFELVTKSIKYSAGVVHDFALGKMWKENIGESGSCLVLEMRQEYWIQACNLGPIWDETQKGLSNSSSRRESWSKMARQLIINSSIHLLFLNVTCQNSSNSSNVEVNPQILRSLNSNSIIGEKNLFETNETIFFNFLRAWSLNSNSKKRKKQIGGIDPGSVKMQLIRESVNRPIHYTTTPFLIYILTDFRSNHSSDKNIWIIHSSFL